MARDGAGTRWHSKEKDGAARKRTVPQRNGWSGEETDGATGNEMRREEMDGAGRKGWSR